MCRPPAPSLSQRQESAIAIPRSRSAGKSSQNEHWFASFIKRKQLQFDDSYLRKLATVLRIL
jgi:hypothetical protein